MGRILEIKNLHFSYGEIQAVKGIDLHIEDGEIVALIGANGAGKTTTLRCISGLLGAPAKGRIAFGSTEINRMKANQISGMGIVQVLEGRRIFPHLTVYENLKMGAYLRKDRNIETDLKKVFQRFPRLEERKKQSGGTLSGGEQQMLAIGRALMGNPRLMLMDEPSLGLAPMIVKEVFGIIRDINKAGISILLVEQNSKIALQTANRGYVLETGKVTIEGPASTLLNHDQVISSYLGGKRSEQMP